ncbi:hypothetical protein Tco_0442920 [Tanacetum coccineum]
MGDKNPFCTLGDYSRPSHEGYRVTIELSDGNNVVPLRFDTIWLVQNGCSFHGLWSEDSNQHLKDFLKLMDSLDLDVANRERTRLRGGGTRLLCRGCGGCGVGGGVEVVDDDDGDVEMVDVEEMLKWRGGWVWVMVMMLLSWMWCGSGDDVMVMVWRCGGVGGFRRGDGEDDDDSGG